MNGLAAAAAEEDYNHILENIEPAFDLNILNTKAPLWSDRLRAFFRDLLAEAVSLARPKAAFKVCRVEIIGKAETILNDTVFTGELLGANLGGRPYAFAYVATEGRELARWADSLSPSGRACCWPIRYAALKLAEKALVRNITEEFSLKQISCMNPGVLKFWPLSQQKPMFELLASLPDSLGVVLSDRFWMFPDFSATGLFFETETKFFNCQLCEVEPCAKRRAAYRGRTGWPPAKPHF
jgi:hypothetical protein